MTFWFLNKDYPGEVKQALADMDAALKLNGGTIVSSSSISHVRRCSLYQKQIYIKHYFSKGHHLKKYFGRSRCRSEWNNLHICKSMQIKIPNIVAYGEDKAWFGLKYRHGVIITEEVPNSDNLKSIAVKHRVDILGNKNWRRRVIDIVADYLRVMHKNKFIHYEMQWRNILVTKDLQNPEVYLFDMPSGSFRWFLFKRGVKRDFYNLYKSAKRFISRTDQLRFYLRYKKITRLSSHDKAHIREILQYYRQKDEV